MHRILLFGRYGQLGWELNRTLATLGDVISLDYPEIDLTRPESLHSVIRDINPGLIINATAYTAVDRAESEPDLARLINANSVEEMARCSSTLHIPLIHYSTDYVFDGAKGLPYVEGDLPNPINTYGATKLEGEMAIQAAGGGYLIFRTSWVYSTRKDSFLMKVLQWGRSQKVLRVVDDQVGSPTWARMLAEITAQVVARAGSELYDWVAERRCVYHLGGEGAASRFDWAQEILRNDPKPQEQVVEALEQARSAEFPTPACRPLYTALDCSRFERVFGLKLPDWRDALMLAMETMT